MVHLLLYVYVKELCMFIYHKNSIYFTLMQRNYLPWNINALQKNNISVKLTCGVTHLTTNTCFSFPILQSNLSAQNFLTTK